jgi:hypothetical protein
MISYICRVESTSYHLYHAGNDWSCKGDEIYILICYACIRGDFESQYYVSTVGDVDWVCLAPDRKVMSVQVV